jgi:AcrR family transcriptional regulator
MELADRKGITALSMRTLAHELGVEAMSLYYYVERKEDLLAGLASRVSEEIEFPEARANAWKGAVRRMAISYHAALRRHPWIHEIRTSPERVGAAQVRYMEWLLGTLRKAGFSARMTHHAYHILDSHILGSAMWAAGVTAAFSKKPMADMAKALFDAFPIAQFPYAHEHAQQHLGGLTKADKQPFELGLDLILDGLDEMRDERPKRQR